MSARSVEQAIREGVVAISSRDYRDIFPGEESVSVRIETPRSRLPHTSHKRYRCTVSSNRGHRLLVYGKRAPRAEFRNLRYLWELLGDSAPRSIPRPLDYLECDHILLMENVEGLQLMSLLIRGCVPGWGAIETARLQRAMEHTASWLARFHNITMGEPYYSAADVKRLEDELERFACFERPELEAISRALSRSLDSLLGIPAVMAHCEYGPRNVLVSDGGVTIIDWPHLARHNVFYDSHLFIQSVRGVQRVLPWAAKRLERLADRYESVFCRDLELDSAAALFRESRLINLIEILLRSRKRLKHARNDKVLRRAQKYIAYSKKQVLAALRDPSRSVG